MKSDILYICSVVYDLIIIDFKIVFLFNSKQAPYLGLRNENSYKNTFSFIMLHISLVITINHKLILHGGKYVKGFPWTDLG